MFSNKLVFKSNVWMFFEYNNFIVLINECFIMFKIKNIVVDNYYNFMFFFWSYMYYIFLFVI